MMVSRLVSAEELLALSDSNIALIFTAMILLKMIYPYLLFPLKFSANRMAAFNHQCFQVYLFDSPVHIFSTSNKDHAFFL